MAHVRLSGGRAAVSRNSQVTDLPMTVRQRHASARYESDSQGHACNSSRMLPRTYGVMANSTQDSEGSTNRWLRLAVAGVLCTGMLLFWQLRRARRRALWWEWADAMVDEASRDSFPASDATSFTPAPFSH